MHFVLPVTYSSPWSDRYRAFTNERTCAIWWAAVCYSFWDGSVSLYFCHYFTISSGYRGPEIKAECIWKGSFKTKEKTKKSHPGSLKSTFSHELTTPSIFHQISAPPGVLHVWELQRVHPGGIHQFILLGDQDLQTIRKEFFSQDTVGNWTREGK